MLRSADARLLFLVSSDYGELSNALYFTQGQPFVSQTLLLLPPRLYQVNKGVLPGPLAEYTSFASILDGIDTWKPDIVFLFSGYLSIFDAPLSIESLERLIAHLKGRGIPIVTSDPFLGALSTAETGADLGRLHPGLLTAFELLKDTIHFYPTRCDRLPRPLAQISVFNSSYDRAPGDPRRPGTERFLATVSCPAEQPFWLFILSTEDYKNQVAKHGAAAFAGYVCRMLNQTVAAGRLPIFIGPGECVRSLEARLPARAEIVLRSFCPHDLFTSLLVDAEYAFYWNMFSNSLVLRIGNGLPVFFFDIGHLGRAYTLAVENYFQGWRPVCLDQRQDLAMPTLQLVEALFRRQLERARDHFRSGPGPEEAIASLLRPSDEQPVTLATAQERAS